MLLHTEPLAFVFPGRVHEEREERPQAQDLHELVTVVCAREARCGVVEHLQRAVPRKLLFPGARRAGQVTGQAKSPGRSGQWSGHRAGQVTRQVTGQVRSPDRSLVRSGHRAGQGRSPDRSDDMMVGRSSPGFYLLPRI